MRLSLRRIFQHFARFSEKQGFPLIITICVAVITASALWTDRTSRPSPSPTPPAKMDISAAQLLQESLRNAATPSPAPAAEPGKWVAPLQEFIVLRAFDADTMQQSGITGVWSIHPGVDLSADPGDPVYAMAQGTILSHGEDALMGVWFRVDHGDTEALYAGMMAAGDFLTGDEVEAEDLLGFVGSGPLDESDMPPHLHLETFRDDAAFDPLTLWNAD